MRPAAQSPRAGTMTTAARHALPAASAACNCCWGRHYSCPHLHRGRCAALAGTRTYHICATRFRVWRAGAALSSCFPRTWQLASSDAGGMHVGRLRIEAAVWKEWRAACLRPGRPRLLLSGVARAVNLLFASVFHLPFTCHDAVVKSSRGHTARIVGCSCEHSRH